MSEPTRLYELVPGMTLMRVVSPDEELNHMERLVESGQVEHMLNLALVKIGIDDVRKVEFALMGTPPELARDMLRMALRAVEIQFANILPREG